MFIKSNYILKDATGQNLPKPFPVEKFKIIDASVPLSVPSIDSANHGTNVSDEQKSWYVKCILDHKKNQDGSFSHKVRWQGWDERYDSWISQDNFDGDSMIKKYWKKLSKGSKLSATSTYI